MTQKSAEETETGSAPLAARWRRLRAAYRVANLATHHVLGFTLKLALLAYFVFALLFLFLRYAVLPNIDYYKGDIERLAGKALGNPVAIARIYASWRGLHPNLFLGDVTLRERASGRQVLALPSVSATLSWWSVLAGSIRFESLEIIRPELEVSRSADGRLSVAGVAFDPAAGGDGSGADWLLAQREIVIRDGRLRWNDALRGAPPLAFDKLGMVLRNKWRGHQFALQATPPASLAAPLDVRAKFVHPVFGARVSNVAMWQGELFADLKEADLAAWKSYLDYPFELAAGRGAVRAWLNFDHAKLAGLTADVSLADVSARLGPDLAPLELTRVAGRIAARETVPAHAEQGRPTFGAHGHEVRLTNFSLATRDGLALPPATLSERYTAPNGGRPAHTELKASLLDLRALAALAERLPLNPAQRALLARFAPRGLLHDFSAEWQGDLPGRAGYRVRGRVAGLGLNAQAAVPARPAGSGLPAQEGAAAIPGFENLSGTLEATERGGNIMLDAHDTVLQLPGYLSAPELPFSQLRLQARWSFEYQDQLRVQVDGLHFVQQGMSGALRGSHIVALGPLAQGPGKADFTGSLSNFDVKTIGRYLPLATPPELRAWLTGALEDGKAQDVSLRLRGDLAQFPFRGDSAQERSRGEFRVAGRIENGKLNYTPDLFAHDGKAPLWPQAERIQGSFLFERARMEIHGETARTGNVELSAVKAVIADLGAPELLLDIDGKAAGPLQEYLKYVAASPVLEWIGGFTDQTSASGSARLALKLHLPLAHLPESKVQGTLQLNNNEVTLFNDMPPVQAVQGKIEFNEKGVALTGLGGSFLGGPVAVSGGTQRDNAIQVRLSGALSADGLRRQYAAPALRELTTRLSGGARYSGLITLRERQLQVAIDSNLAGLGLDFPAPLHKAPAELLPLRFVLNGALPNEAGLMRDDIRLTLGPGMQAHYQRQKRAGEAWRVLRGGIGVNAAAPEPDSGIGINVSLKSLNVDAWSGLKGVIAGGAGPAAPSGPDLGQYVLPDFIAARAGELILGERKLDNVVAGVTQQGGLWQVNIDARQASGYLSWNATPAGPGKLTARLSALIIPESAEADVKDLLEGPGPAQTMPALDIVAERFELFNRPLGRLELQAHNPQASGREWRITRLSLANPDGELKGTGSWLLRDGQSSTSLNFTLDIVDAGRLLDRFGFADTLRKGKGRLSGELAWNGLPYSLDIPSLTGQIQMQVESGQFLKQDPGAAKLLGVLSLQALPRLLKLDFHDVFSQGLAFDGISASATIRHGVAKTDNLKMHGVAATVLMDGTADIANESTNLHVVVIPEFNLGTGPLVYALAVNPVVGIGSFLAQLFLRAPVMKALTYQMQVTGPWKAPLITKLDNGKLEPAPVKSN